MKQKVYVFLAEGFEEIEALTPVDVLRRAGVEVVLVGVYGTRVMGGHGITVSTDAQGKDFVLPEDAAMVVLPGGGAGVENLSKSETVREAVLEANRRGIYVAAICAAPTLLNELGLLDGKRVTAFPSHQYELKNSEVTGAAVEVDGNMITSRSMGTALAFARVLASVLVGQEKADEVMENLYPET